MSYTIDITITNPDGQQAILSQSFTFTPAPVISAVSPTSGPVAGGTPVTISGQHFHAGATVLFGANPATSVQVSADGSTLTCVSPPQ